MSNQAAVSSYPIKLIKLIKHQPVWLVNSAQSMTQIINSNEMIDQLS